MTINLYNTGPVYRYTVPILYWKRSVHRRGTDGRMTDDSARTDVVGALIFTSTRTHAACGDGMFISLPTFHSTCCAVVFCTRLHVPSLLIASHFAHLDRSLTYLLLTHGFVSCISAHLLILVRVWVLLRIWVPCAVRDCLPPRSYTYERTRMYKSTRVSLRPAVYRGTQTSSSNPSPYWWHTETHSPA